VRVCAACGAANDERFRFCGSCGSSLSGRPCPACGFDNPAANRFCGHCGAALSEEPAQAAPRASEPAAAPLAQPAAPAPEERKLATVLFADVVGFTTLAEEADPEAIAARVDAAFRRMAAAVTAHGGTVDKYMGDCLMAVFGVPVSHDDDAERAIAAALAMQALGDELPFSIGINTGDVLVTAVGGDGGRTVIGDAVNVAARLEKVAGAGEILVGPLTAELAGERTELRPRPPLLLKGRRQPVDVWEAVAVGRTSRRHREGVPLIGRDDELAFLLAQWRRCRVAERAVLVVVTGEAGIGKTRLLDELAERVIADGGAAARASFPAYSGMGTTQMAGELIDDLGPSGDADVQARVRSVVGETHPALRGLSPSALDQEQRWAFRRLVEEKAAEKPLLLILDDLHRSGGKAMELLADLAQRAGRSPVMLVVAGRSDAAWLSAFAAATVVRLEPLGAADATALATALVPLNPLDPGDVAAAVERSAGNPLYLRELVAMAGTVRGGTAGLPPTLQAILAARLDALDPTEKVALQHVAVIGAAATLEQVEGLGPPGVSRALRPLAAAGLLDAGADNSFDVADPLLREVAYEMLPHRARADLHRRAAQLAGSPVARARHLERAVEHDPLDDVLRAEAAGALAEAALGLLDGVSMSDGVRLMEQAVALGHRDENDLLGFARRLVDADRGADALAMLDLLTPSAGSRAAAEKVHIGANALVGIDSAAALARFDEAAELWNEIGDVEKEGWAHANKALAYYVKGQVADAGYELDEGLRRFLEVGSREGELGVYRLLQLSRPDDPRVPVWLGESLRHAVAVGDRTGQMGAVHALSWYHFVRFRLGGVVDHVVVDTYSRRCTELGIELGSRANRVHGLLLRANLARMVGDLDLGRRLLEDASASSPGEDAIDEDLHQAVRFSLALAADPSTDVAAPEIVSLDPRASAATLIVVEAVILAGRVDDASRVLHANRARPELGRVESITMGVMIGLQHLLRGRLSHARTALETAVAAADACWARPAAAAGRAMLAEVAARDGDRTRAAEMMAGVPHPPPEGLAGALAMRAHAAMGDEGAAATLVDLAATLAAPGLLPS
jgi:class 3 adenylate cyclase